MEFNAPLSLRQRQKFSEGSKLASSRDDRNVTLLWKKIAQMQHGQSAAVQALQKTISQVSRTRRIIYGGGGTSGSAIQTFQVVSDGGDWYNCYTFDGVNVGSQIIQVAKSQDLRCILPTANPAGGAWASKTIRTITYTYSYTPSAGATSDGVNVVEYTRSVTGSDSSSATSFVTPCLNIGDIISAFQTSFAGPATLVGVTWQALTDGRAWADNTPEP